MSVKDLTANLQVKAWISHYISYFWCFFYVEVTTNQCPSPNYAYPDSKVHGTNMGPIWGRQDPGGSHVGPTKFAIWVANFVMKKPYMVKSVLIHQKLVQGGQ